VGGDPLTARPVATLLDCFDRPRTVRVRTHNPAHPYLTLSVPQLRLRDLADLQAWVRDQSWDPFDAPDTDDPALFWAMVLHDGQGWPPPLGSTLAALATPAEGYAEEFAHVAFGRHNGLDRDTARRVAGAAMADVVPWQAIVSAAYAIDPADIASRMLNAIDGAIPEDDGPPIDWPLAIAGLVVEHGIGFDAAEDLTIGQFRLMRSLTRDDKGRLRHEPRGVPPRPRPGEPGKDADRRRKALLERAEAELEAQRSGTGAT
jgi:hypothetical protein